MRSPRKYNHKKQSAATRRRYAIRKAAGICVCCCKPWEGPTVNCPRCSAAKSGRWKDNSKAFRKRREDAGVCVRCGGPRNIEMDGNYKTCLSCRSNLFDWR